MTAVSAELCYFETESQGVHSMDAVELRSRHIIPVPTDQIVKVAASHLSLSLSISRPSLPFTLSQSLAVNPWFHSSQRIPLPLSARLLNVVCALPER